MSASANTKSLYDILSVNKNDSSNEIRKAYLKLAKTHHPDKGGNPELFKEIVRASEILTDERKRKMYDDYGIIEGETDEQSHSGFPFGINLNSIFGNIFEASSGFHKEVRKGKKPAPTVQTLKITLEQFYFGYNLDIPVNRQCFCPDCGHTGAKSKERCKNCNGRGEVSQIVQMGPMTMHTSGPCINCQGKGEFIIEKCNKCSGTGFIQEKRTLSVKIPAGTVPGETYVFPEICSDHIMFERPGDAHIVVVEDTDDPSFKYFKRTGNKFQNLETTIALSLAESLIGCTVKIDGHPGYENGLYVQIPAGSFQGDKYCLPGFGHFLEKHATNNTKEYGDLIINIDVTVSDSERNLYRTDGCKLLTQIFEDKVRKYESSDKNVQTNLQLHKAF